MISIHRLFAVFSNWLRPFVCFVFLYGGQYPKLICQNELKGMVLHGENKLAISGATVFLEETNFWTETNSDGYFILVYSGIVKKNLIVQKLGFEKIIIKPSDWNRQKNDAFVIKMQELVQDEIVIIDDKLKSESVIREKMERFEYLPNPSNNVESLLPSIGLGVRFSAGGELSSQYSVRGGSYDENLVVINDFEIIRPQLIRNGQQEGLSFPNPDLIRELSFSSGGFEPRFGDKQSSVLDIKYKIPDETKASISASFLGIQGHLEGSRKLFRKSEIKNFKYLAGVRYKTNQYLLNSLDTKGEYQPHFIDAQTFLSYDLSPSLQWSWIGNINRSQFQLIPESGSQAKGSLFFILRLNTQFEGREVDYFNHYMSGTSLSYIPKNKKYLQYFKWISSLYRGQEAEQFDILGYYRLSEIEFDQKNPEGKEIKLWGEGIQHRYGRNYFDHLVQHHEFRAGFKINQESKSISQFIQFGINFRKEDFLDRLQEWERLDSAGYSIPYSFDSVVLNAYISSDHRITNYKSAIWLQDRLQLSLNHNIQMQITAGVRGHFNAMNREMLWCPRLKLELFPQQHDQNLRFWFATGYYPQVSFYRELRTRDGDVNTDLKAQKAWHWILGWNNDFQWLSVSPKRFRWISEMYYKSLWDMVSYNLDNVRIRYSGQNDSEAYAIGWDNRIHGEFVPGVESWVNLSLLQTKERIIGVQHLRPTEQSDSSKVVRYVPRPTDQLGALSVFFQDYLPGNPRMKMNLQGSIASGLPYGFATENETYRNLYRFKTYHRLDIGFSYTFLDRTDPKLPKRQIWPWMNSFKKFWIAVEVFNLLDTKNEASVRWIKAYNNYEFAIPNFLSSRRINLRMRVDF